MEAPAYIDDVTSDLSEATAGTVRAIPFLRRETDGTGIVANLAEIVGLPLKGCVPTAATGFAPRQVLTSELRKREGTRVPTGTEEYVVERLVKGGEGERR